MATLDFWLNIGFRAAWIKVALEREEGLNQGITKEVKVAQTIASSTYKLILLFYEFFNP